MKKLIKTSITDCDAVKDLTFDEKEELLVDGFFSLALDLGFGFDEIGTISKKLALGYQEVKKFTDDLSKSLKGRAENETKQDMH